MGLGSWLAWLGEEIENLEALKAITKDEEQLKIINKMIESAKSKMEK